MASKGAWARSLVGQVLIFWMALCCGLFAHRALDSDPGKDLTVPAVIFVSGLVIGAFGLLFFFFDTFCPCLVPSALPTVSHAVSPSD